VIRILNGLALFVLAILVAQLLASCDLDKARSSKGAGEKVGTVHHASASNEEEPTPTEEEEPPPVVDPNSNEICWGDVSFEVWLENDCPGDPPPGGP
jgi:hypothetical protein